MGSHDLTKKIIEKSESIIFLNPIFILDTTFMENFLLTSTIKVLYLTKR